MKDKQKGYVQLDFTGIIIGSIVVGVAIGVSITLGVPILWEWVKPILHAITA